MLAVHRLRQRYGELIRAEIGTRGRTSRSGHIQPEWGSCGGEIEADRTRSTRHAMVAGDNLAVGRLRSRFPDNPVARRDPRVPRRGAVDAGMHLTRLVRRRSVRGRNRNA